jgi:prepilin-type N-terminal cleavage/methylation domain-containing protein
MQARNQKGFSLVEAVVALAVASLIALSAAALYRASGQGASQARSSTSQASRVLFEQLRELSSATYVQPVNPGCVSSACGGNGFHALIRTTDPSAGREFTYQVSYLPQEDGLYRTVDGRNPQKVYPGRGSVIFEFYDANGNRIYSSGITTWVARVVARAGEGAGSAAATFTMPTGGGGQNAAYSRQIPSGQPPLFGVAVLTGPWDGTPLIPNTWGDLYTPVNLRDLSQGFVYQRTKLGLTWVCAGGGVHETDEVYCTRLIRPAGYSAVFVFGESFLHNAFPGPPYVMVDTDRHLPWRGPVIQAGNPAYIRECRAPAPLTSGEILLGAAVARKLLVNWGYSMPPYAGPLNPTPGPWQILTWNANPISPGYLEDAWAMVPNSMRPGAQNWTVLPMGGYCTNNGG